MDEGDSITRPTPTKRKIGPEDLAEAAVVSSKHPRLAASKALKRVRFFGNGFPTNLGYSEAPSPSQINFNFVAGEKPWKPSDPKPPRRSDLIYHFAPPGSIQRGDVEQLRARAAGAGAIIPTNIADPDKRVRVNACASDTKASGPAPLSTKDPRPEPWISKKFICYARIAGRFARVLVDTGCNTVMLNAAFARRFGLSTYQFSNLHVEWGEDGKGYTATEMTCQSIKLFSGSRDHPNAYEHADVPWILAPLRVDAIIGLPFLFKLGPITFGEDPESHFPWMSFIVDDVDYRINAQQTGPRGLGPDCDASHLVGFTERPTRRFRRRRRAERSDARGKRSKNRQSDGSKSPHESANDFLMDVTAFRR